MGLSWVLLLTATFCAAPVRAGDLADDRLAEPGAFGRLADAARSRTDAPAVPLGAAFASPRAFRDPAQTAPTPTSAERYPSLSPVPMPNRSSSRPQTQAATAAAQSASPARPRRSGPSPTGVALVAIGALLLIAIRPERARKAATFAETWTPPPTWKREWPATSAPAPLPPLRFREPKTPPHASPGWGFSDECDT